MRALSIKQPWAWLICAGYKDIENRSWPVGRNSRHGPYSSYHQANFKIELPCRIYVHASKQGDLCSETIDFILKRIPLHNIHESFFTKEKFGAIIGEVDITDCVIESESRWFEGPYGFVLTNPKLYDRPIPYKGQLGFFEVSLRQGYEAANV